MAYLALTFGIKKGVFAGILETLVEDNMFAMFKAVCPGEYFLCSMLRMTGAFSFFVIPRSVDRCSSRCVAANFCSKLWKTSPTDAYFSLATMVRTQKCQCCRKHFSALLD